MTVRKVELGSLQIVEESVETVFGFICWGANTGAGCGFLCGNGCIGATAGWFCG